MLQAGEAKWTSDRAAASSLSNRMIRSYVAILALVLHVLVVHVVDGKGPTPPPPRHHGYHKMMALIMNNAMNGIMRDLDEWTPNDKQNIWELSGLEEGDIMTDSSEEVSRNAVRDSDARWPGGVVPYHISDAFGGRSDDRAEIEDE